MFSYILLLFVTTRLLFMSNPLWAGVSRTHLFSWDSDQAKQSADYRATPEWSGTPLRPHFRRPFGVVPEVMTQNPIEPRMGITSHHLLAKEVIKEHMAVLRLSKKLRRIILIGPDHFHRGSRSLSISKLPWKTATGTLPIDGSLFNRLKNKFGPKIVDDEAFTFEHSIRVPLAFIGANMGDGDNKVSVVPIMLRADISGKVLDALVENLQPELNNETYLLLSMDFSHYKGLQESNSEDLKSQAAIVNRTVGEVKTLDIDCPQGLYVLLRLAEKLGLQTKITAHTNSAEILGDLSLTSTTSYFNIFFDQQLNNFL